jgi:hypothetical protein
MSGKHANRALCPEDTQTPHVLETGKHRIPRDPLSAPLAATKSFSLIFSPRIFEPTRKHSESCGRRREDESREAMSWTVPMKRSTQPSTSGTSSRAAGHGRRRLVSTHQPFGYMLCDSTGTRLPIFVSDADISIDGVPVPRPAACK